MAVGWRHSGTSRPTYCLTSYISVGRVLVCQPSRPSVKSWHFFWFRVNYYKVESNHAAATYHIFMNYMLVGFVARYCCEGVWTCNPWVSVLSKAREGESVWGTPELLGQLCLTYSSVVRALVCQPIRPRLKSWHVSFRDSTHETW